MSNDEMLDYYERNIAPGITTTTCPRCGAMGTPCSTPRGKPTRMHGERYAAWQVAQPPKPDDRYDKRNREDAARSLERFAARGNQPPERLPAAMPHWMKYERRQVIEKVKRRLRKPLPAWEDADEFLDDLQAGVMDSLSWRGGYDDYGIANAGVEVEVRDDVNTPESFARGELRVRVSVLFTNGERVTYTVGYAQRVAA